MLAGKKFKERINNGKILPLIGVYDVFSALVASKYFDGIFISGFSVAASSYGLPDVGFVNWRDQIDISSRIKHVLPNNHILVDIDDGFGDEVIASNTVKMLENNDLSAVMIEDQKRPRMCGHFNNKEVLPTSEYLVKLKTVLSVKKDIFVIARTDSLNHTDGLERAIQYANAGADGVMVEAISDLSIVKQLSQEINCPIMVNQLQGGKSPNWSLQEMEDAGVSIVIYSTPALFSAQYGMEQFLRKMMKNGIMPTEGAVNMEDCVKQLKIPTKDL